VSFGWKTSVWILGGGVLAIVVSLIATSIIISRRARVWAEDWLSHEFNSKVEMSAFRVSIPFPTVKCQGENLELQFQGRQDLPPLLSVRRFTIVTSLRGLLRNPRRIQYVELDGLQMNVPPREEGNRGAATRNLARKFTGVRFDEIHSENATLRILTRNPEKDPLEFGIRHLYLNSHGVDGALDFHATLFNPKPPGDISSDGTFGPWNNETPSLTPVSGRYDFANADLSVFPGIAGTLTSNGTFQGVIEQINIDGTTNTPDFRVTRAGHPLDLSTSFHATVDGTDGDTYLQPVEAHFGSTILSAHGSIAGAKGMKGKTITLELSGSRARIEDLLLLAVKESPAMTGPIQLKTKFILTPGPEQIPERLNLNGSFEMNSVHFTRSAVQQKFDNLSKRGQGKPKEVVNPEEADSADDVASKMNGTFQLAHGILSLSEVHFVIPGVEVLLAGTYALNPETLDLHGSLRMQARLSQTTTGFRSFLLKLADPFFSKQGNGALVPIKISGSAQHPVYGLDLGHKSEASSRK
jgi:hypothetical protein